MRPSREVWGLGCLCQDGCFSLSNSILTHSRMLTQNSVQEKAEAWQSKWGNAKNLCRKIIDIQGCSLPATFVPCTDSFIISITHMGPAWGHSFLKDLQVQAVPCAWGPWGISAFGSTGKQSVESSVTRSPAAPVTCNHCPSAGSNCSKRKAPFLHYKICLNKQTFAQRELCLLPHPTNCCITGSASWLQNLSFTHKGGKIGCFFSVPVCMPHHAWNELYPELFLYKPSHCSRHGLWILFLWRNMNHVMKKWEWCWVCTRCSWMWHTGKGWVLCSVLMNEATGRRCDRALDELLRNFHGSWSCTGSIYMLTLHFHWLKIFLIKDSSGTKSLISAKRFFKYLAPVIQI